MDRVRVAQGGSLSTWIYTCRPTTSVSVRIDACNDQHWSIPVSFTPKVNMIRMPITDADAHAEKYY